jgi:hypothetical protein
MFKDSNAYNQAIKRIVFLQGLERDDRITADDLYELRELEVAAQQYEDVMDAEAQAEYEFMLRFEDAFMAYQDR